MKLNSIIIAVSSLFFVQLAVAQEIEVVNEASSGEENSVQSTQNETLVDKTEETIVAPKVESVEAPLTVDEVVPSANQADDDWSLMAQLLEAKKQNEAKAKAKIDELSEENEELNVVVEENNATLAAQEKTIGSLELQLNDLQTSASQIEAQLATMQENTDTVSYEFKKLKFKNTASKLTPFLYAATAIVIADKLDASQDSKLIYALGAFSAGTLIESTDYGLSFQLTKIVYKQ